MFFQPLAKLTKKFDHIISPGLHRADSAAPHLLEVFDLRKLPLHHPRDGLDLRGRQDDPQEQPPGVNVIKLFPFVADNEAQFSVRFRLYSQTLD